MSLRSWHGKTPRRARAASRSPSRSRCAYRQRLVALDGGQYRQQRLFRQPLAREIKTALHCRAERSSGRNDFGYAGFGGACPPAGDKPHRYRFTVWALDVPTLPVDAGASGALVGYLLHSHALASAQLTAMAGR